MMEQRYQAVTEGISVIVDTTYINKKQMKAYIQRLIQTRDENPHRAFPIAVAQRFLEFLAELNAAQGRDDGDVKRIEHHIALLKAAEAENPDRTVCIHGLTRMVAWLDLLEKHDAAMERTDAAIEASEAAIEDSETMLDKADTQIYLTLEERLHRQEMRRKDKEQRQRRQALRRLEREERLMWQAKMQRIQDKYDSCTEACQ